MSGTSTRTRPWSTTRMTFHPKDGTQIAKREGKKEF
jgi:hypothetical protein